MYNSIYPVNINYRNINPYSFQGSNQNNRKQDEGLNNASSQGDSYIPASNRINISQILMDFRNTILAINAPSDVQDEINIYLGLVEKESKKETPSRDIILSNLRNASKISDNFIATALGKKSNVVEGWITTIFRQDINLKSNPDEINPDFLLKFPSNSQAVQKPPEQPVNTVIDNKTTPQSVAQAPQATTDELKDEIKITEIPDSEVIPEPVTIDIDSSVDVADETNIFLNQPQDETKTAFSPNNESDKKARMLYIQARKLAGSNDNSAAALNLLNEALGYLSFDSNSNIKAAIHLERGKIFDEYDYIDYALRDYFEASKASDLNLKANAFFKSGLLYDEFKEYDPALDNYLSSVAYSGEADNLSAQSTVLSKISEMYARLYDVDNAHDYADLAIDAAIDSKDSNSIAKVYSAIAQNYQYLGDNKKALENYRNALEEFSHGSESYEQMGYNYSQAADVMRQLGNEAKAAKLQARANQYYLKAQLSLQQQELAS